jgi:hypothetical protein
MGGSWGLRWRSRLGSRCCGSRRKNWMGKLVTSEVERLFGLHMVAETAEQCSGGFSFS